MRIWTEAQQAAISATGDVLVSAAAGSGKTATLTERIVRKIKNGADIRRMLVVTFTRAAADELRDRISLALTEAVEENPDDAHITSQLLAVGEAKIGTIHSFCMSVLKQKYAVLGLPPSFRIADSGETKMLESTVMDELLDELYEAPDACEIIGATDKPCADFITLADNFTQTKNDAGLSERLLMLYGRLKSQTRGVFLLEDCAELLLFYENEDFLKTPFGEADINCLKRRSAHYKQCFAGFIAEMTSEPVFNKAYVPAAVSDTDFLDKLDAAIAARDFDCCAEIYNAFTPQKLGSARGEKPDYIVNYLAQRDAFKKAYAADKAKLWSCPPHVIQRHFHETSALCRELFFVLSEFDRRFSARKSRAGLCDFTDLERLTMRLFYSDGAPTPLAAETAAAFDEIYIDEYQDTNRVQDAIFAAVAGAAGDNSTRRVPRFMVGDIKQSIYRFRGAEPSIFAAYRRKYLVPSQTEGSVIFMSHNFRSDGTVIDFVNRVSEITFGASHGIDYTAEDALVCGNRDAGEPVRMYLVSKDKPDNTDDSDINDTKIDACENPEAAYVAKLVYELCEHGVKKDGTPIKPSDIAVLLRSANTRGQAYSDAIKQNGFACSAATGSDFFDSPEIRLAVCLLMSVDNLTRDVYVAGMLCSPLFDFTLGELVRLGQRSGNTPIWREIVKCASADNGGFPSELVLKCKIACEKLSRWREQAAAVTADKFIRYLFAESGIYAAGGSETAHRRLDMLYEYARRYESTSFHGLHGFIEYLSTLREQSDAPDATADPDSEHVSVMSVHASKGLEFPVVILADCAHRFNTSDLSEDILFCPTMPRSDGETEPAVAVKLRVTDEPAKQDTLIRLAVASRSDEEMIYEEMRILYVAMTRARERLIITAAAKDPVKLLENTENTVKYGGGMSELSLLSAKSCLDYLLPACLTSDSAEISIIEAQGIERVYRQAHNIQAIADTDEITRIAAERFKYRSYRESVPSIPAKLSVSRLYPSILDEGESAVKSTPESEKIPTVPTFISAVSDTAAGAAQRGTATHVFLQFADFNAVVPTVASVESELERLVRYRFIPENCKRDVYVKEAAQFFSSDIFSRMKHADKLYREFRFNVLLDASRFTTDPDMAAKLAKRGESVLVQGVIDAFFIDSAGAVLVDYKTDRLTHAEIENDRLAYAKLKQRHAEQLTYYVEAVRRIFGVSEVGAVIYSTCSGKCYQILKGGDVK